MNTNLRRKCGGWVGKGTRPILVSLGDTPVVRTAKKKPLEQPITKFTLAILDGKPSPFLYAPNSKHPYIIKQRSPIFSSV